MVSDAQTLIFVGLALSVTSTTFSNFGQNIQKYAFLKDAQRVGSSSQPNQYSLWRWWVGLGFVIFGAAFDFVALKFAPQSVIMPAGAISLGINPIFASLWLGEKLTRGDVHGTLLIIIGAVGVACAYAVLGTPVEKEYTLSQLLNLYTKPIMLVYGISIVLLVRYLMALMKKCERLQAIAAKNEETDEDGFATLPLPATQHQAVALPERYADVQQYHPITYAALSGIFGAQSVLFAKSTVELLGTSFSKNGTNQFKDPWAFGVVICMLLSIAGQTHFLAEGLKHFDALIIVPVFQCFIITFSILGGATYFEELYGFSLEQWVCFLISVLTALFGVGVLSRRPPSKQAVATVAEELNGCGGDDENGRMLFSMHSVGQSPHLVRKQVEMTTALDKLDNLEVGGGTVSEVDESNDSLGSFLFETPGAPAFVQPPESPTLSLPFKGIPTQRPLWADGVVHRQNSSGPASPDHQGNIAHI